MKSVALAIEESTPRGIAGGIARLINSGELAGGDRLPTVRALASELGVSPATVSHAWQTLAGAGLIVSRGRSGSIVRSVPRDWLPLRYRGLDGSADARLDLSRGTPDPELLPTIGLALGRLSGRADTRSYQDKPDIPELHDLLRETWPSPVESLTVTNGALDAIDRAMATLVRYGDRVIVENPTFPPFMDLLEHYGLDAVPVGLDDEGMIPAEFATALATAPALILLQPRAHNPTGISMSPDRAEHLATLLRRSRVATKTIVIEDDHSWAIAMAGDVSLARFIPERVLHVRSFSKSHGPDLRIGALGGPRELIDRAVARRLLGPGWTSRMLQGVVFELLTAVESLAQVDAARRAYGQRQVDFAAALGRHGVSLIPRDGINMWLPVADERAATVSLAASGIRVAPGTPFRLGSGDAGDGQAHVRVTVGMLRDDPDTIAGAIAIATRL